ncbi:hypothetical protein MMC25_000836 [Agyrium rufum]|nr:hypothetical protein [Agyrium rufum]
MAELAFAKTFLSTLDNRPIKYKSDYAVDLKTLEIKTNYALPRNAQPMTKPSAPPALGSTPSITVSLKSLRNPQLDLQLTAQPLTTTSILDLKKAIEEKLEGAASIDKIRLLYKKKPCSDAKSLKDVLGDDVKAGAEAEFGVMVIGGVGTAMPAAESAEKMEGVVTEGDASGTAAAKSGEVEEAPVAQGQSGLEVLETEEFWNDLLGFMEQRVRNKEVSEKAVGLFEEVWREKK